MEKTTITPITTTILTTDFIELNGSGDLENNIEIWDHQITFEIPSNLDLERIKSLDNFTTLLRGGYGEESVRFSDANSDINYGSVFGKWSDNVDYQIVLNYLWIGVVTSLVIMSAVFIVFSCYFYRKFMEWKKCNKDIRSQLPSDLYRRGGTAEDGYYQMESPPCYTIATGLPSYDEALFQAHFTFGMRFVLPWESPDDGVEQLGCYRWEGCTSQDMKEIENPNNNHFISGGCDDEGGIKDYAKDNADCTEVVVMS